MKFSQGLLPAEDQKGFRIGNAERLQGTGIEQREGHCEESAESNATGDEHLFFRCAMSVVRLISTFHCIKEKGFVPSWVANKMGNHYTNHPGLLKCSSALSKGE